jgi:GTP-binding protein
MTRDQIAAECTIKDKRFILIDTGGFFDFKKDPLSAQVKEKAWEASRDADILLFILDGKRGLLPAEEDLYFAIKKLDKPVLVVVNKIDSPSEEEKIGDFFRLGVDRIFPVSAEHKRNFEYLEEGLYDLLRESPAEEKETEALKIAIIGRINVGKSSIVNRLCGHDKLIVSEIPGTTRDSTDTLIYRNKKAFCLVDMAGIRRLSRTKDKREKAGIIKAKRDIKRADVLCLILDAQEFPTRQDTAIAHLAEESGKPLIIALNKWDLVEKDSQSSEEFKANVYDKLDFVSYAPLLFISALTGQRVVKILDLADEIYANASKRIPTSTLNDFLAWIHTTHPPISTKKMKIKIKYIVQKKSLPPTFFLFTHSKSPLAPAYRKFLKRLLRDQFGFAGSPIRLYLKRN